MQLGSVLPFMLMSVETGKVKLNTTRIVEAIIIAAIGGLLAGFIATKELKIEIFNIKAQLSALGNKVDCLDNRLWEHDRGSKK